MKLKLNDELSFAKYLTPCYTSLKRENIQHQKLYCKEMGVIERQNQNHV